MTYVLNGHFGFEGERALGTWGEAGKPSRRLWQLSR